MTAQELKNSILQLAIQGKLVKQDPNDEPASVLLEKIKEERKKLIKEKKIKKEKYSEIYKDPSDNHYYEKFEDSTVNDITDEIPFDIPDTWKWCRIENFEEINLGFTYKPDYTSEGVYFLSVKDISGGKIDFSKAKKVSRETYDKASYGSKPHKGDILFGRVGTMGKPQIIETNEEFCIFVSLGFFRDHLDIMNKHYIVLWMESLLFQEQINRNVKGAAQKNLNTGWLKKFLIPIPPLKEQQRIIEKYENLLPYISRYDDIYERLEKINNNYKEDLKKSILQYAIQGKLVQQDQNDEPADILINKILSEKRELIKSKQIKKENLSVIYKDNTDNQFYEKFDDGTINNITEEIPFEIPDNWAWTRIKNICIINPKNNLDDNLDVSFIPMNLIEAGYTSKHTFEVRKWKNIKKGFTHFKENDIGIAKITPCFQNRKSVIFKNLKNGYGAGTTELHVIRNISELMVTKFLFYIFKSNYFIINGIHSFSRNCRATKN